MTGGAVNDPTIGNGELNWRLGIELFDPSEVMVSALVAMVHKQLEHGSQILNETLRQPTVRGRVLGKWFGSKVLGMYVGK